MELVVRNANKIFYLPNGEVDFSLYIPEIVFPCGKVSFILGKMGSGKSLFLKLLNGEEQNTKGNLISLLGEKPLRNDISIVRQKVEENLCNELTVEENLLLRLNPTTLKEKVFPKKYFCSQIKDLLIQQNEILKKRKQPCENLSGGQKQTLSFIANTVNKSSVLCLDEFLSSTDFETSRQLRNKSKEYAIKNNAVVIIISHDFKIALTDADLIYIFKDGQIKQKIDRQSENWTEEFIIKQMTE